MYWNCVPIHSQVHFYCPLSCSKIPKRVLLSRICCSSSIFSSKLLFRIPRAQRDKRGCHTNLWRWRLAGMQRKGRERKACGPIGGSEPQTDGETRCFRPHIPPFRATPCHPLASSGECHASCWATSVGNPRVWSNHCRPAASIWSAAGVAWTNSCCAQAP